MKPFRLFVHVIAVTLVTAVSSDILAQGSVFGAVQTSDLSVPAKPDIVFFGFVGNTNDEIRLSSSVGAGYDKGFWFDDFQNYTFKAPGLQYDYYFFDVSSAEGFRFSSVIPSNSFQQENIQLTPTTWPPVAAGLSATKLSHSTIQIEWQASTGYSYHIFRRSSSSSGSFFRIDDPTGTLGGSGVIGSRFTDTAAAASDGYDYVVLASDGSMFSPPSEIVSSESSLSCCVGNTGNVDNDPSDGVDVADLTVLIDHLFITLKPLSCRAEGNIDGDPAGGVDIADLTTLIDHLFVSLAPTSPCQ